MLKRELRRVDDVRGSRTPTPPLAHVRALTSVCPPLCPFPAQVSEVAEESRRAAGEARLEARERERVNPQGQPGFA